MPHRPHLRLAPLLAILIALLIQGCVAKPDTNLMASFNEGQMGRAREALRSKIDLNKPSSNPDKDYVLQRLRLGIVTLADGYAYEGSSPLDRVYELVRAQGVNKDAGFSSVVLNEDLKVWKGEPFEQALALHYVGMHYAMQGSWDNAHAAAAGTLLPLKNVTRKSDGTSKTPVDPEKNAKSPDQVAKDKSVDPKLGSYVLERTNFTLGYLMTGIASQQMARSSGDPDRIREANDYFEEAVKLNPSLQSLVAQLRENRYNTLFIVDFGQGPQKIGTGPDESIASFRPLQSSDQRRIVISLGNQTAAYPWVCDVNAMSIDHRWNDLEELRVAKSIVGTVLVAGGAGTLAYGAANRDATVAAIGAGLLVAGAIAKAGAHADTRYCEVMPQRVYIVPAMIASPNSTITLEVEGSGQSRLVLAGLSPPSDKTANLRYVHLNGPSPVSYRWPTSGQILYANDFAPNAGRVALPYILGGDCVRIPSESALDAYHRAGFLREMTTPSEIEQLYREEGIRYTIQDENGTPSKHVLEGGTSLLCPYPGTIGYARLFGHHHNPYVPRSPRVAQLAAQLREQVAALRGQGGASTPVVGSEVVIPPPTRIKKNN